MYVYVKNEKPNMFACANKYAIVDDTKHKTHYKTMNHVKINLNEGNCSIYVTHPR